VETSTGRLLLLEAVHDLAIIVVSTNEAHWLRPCLRTVFERAGAIDLDVVVADNQSTDGTRELVESEFPAARVVTCANRGFSHANNRGLMTCDARYALFLNPDTEILEGTFEELVRALDARPTVGLAGVKQRTADGSLYPTIRRFPTAFRALGEAFAAGRLGRRAQRLTTHELDWSTYEREVACDWTSGSFMLVRREAIESAGFMDERSFIYSEEPDLCRRIKQAGWEVRHLPSMTILHHAEKAGINPKMAAQQAVARLHYARKFMPPAHRAAFIGSMFVHHGLRYALGGSGRRAEARRALRILVGLDEPPFGPPPELAVAVRDEHALVS
jgi:N-acetylglucosaminyl-diphospho-decaprenol L-rhamnosyltransferase